MENDDELIGGITRKRTKELEEFLQSLSDLELTAVNARSLAALVRRGKVSLERALQCCPFDEPNSEPNTLSFGRN